MDQGQDQDQDQDQERRERDGEGLGPAASPSPEEQPTQNPFLRQLHHVKRQGVPEAGAVNPGPPPKPVRSGGSHTDRVPSTREGEKR